MFRQSVNTKTCEKAKNYKIKCNFNIVECKLEVYSSLIQIQTMNVKLKDAQEATQYKAREKKHRNK